jgi:heme A synthase
MLADHAATGERLRSGTIGTVSERRRPSQVSRLFIVALYLTLAGAGVLGVGLLVDLPMVVWLPGVAAFLLGAALVFVVTFREAREEDVSFARSLGRGVRGAIAWITWMLP